MSLGAGESPSASGAAHSFMIQPKSASSQLGCLQETEDNMYVPSESQSSSSATMM